MAKGKRKSEEENIHAIRRNEVGRGASVVYIYYSYEREKKIKE